ncbi:MAG: hypothetical protein HN738_13850, partial [Gammaproteobacteria bacterium]|nr:hypothetical protein [Gammaproteobacteria bacterium]
MDRLIEDRQLVERNEFYWKLTVSSNESGSVANRFSDHFNLSEARLDFFPQNPKLHLGETITHTSMDAKT